MAKVTNILAGDGFRGDIDSIISTTTKEEKKKLREKFYKDLIDNAVAVPVGIAEGAVGLPGDIEGLARGAYRAYNAEDGERLEAFGSAFADTTLPSTQQIQDFTNEHLLDNEFGEMVRRGKYGRFAGELIAPASVVTAPTKTLAKGAGALSDSKFFQKLANPLDVDVQPSMFIGERAKNFPHEALAKAKKLEAEGKSPKDIWETMANDPLTTKHDPRTVSLGKDVDGFWKAEVDDSAMTALPMKRSFRQAKLKDVVSPKDNPFFDNYPFMADDPVIPSKAKSFLGQYSPNTYTRPEYRFTRWGAENQGDLKVQYDNIYDTWKNSTNGKKYDELRPQVMDEGKKLRRYWSGRGEKSFEDYNKKVDSYNAKIRKLKELKQIDHPSGNINELRNRLDNGQDLVTGEKVSSDAYVNLGTAKHEMGHGVQHTEGWGRGSGKKGYAHDIESGEQNSIVIDDRGLLSREERAKHFPFQHEEGNPYTYKFPLEDIRVKFREDPRNVSMSRPSSELDDIPEYSNFFDTINKDPLPKRLTHDIEYKINHADNGRINREVIEPNIFNDRNNFLPSGVGVPDDYLNFLHSKANRGDIMGGRVPKDAPIQPATNTFYDDIRVNELFPEPTREVFEFTKGSKHSRGGPVSLVKDINVPYETTRKALPESDNIYKGAVQGRPTQPNSWLADAVGSRKPYKDKVIYKQDKTKGISTTGITPERAERLRRGEIKLPEPRNNTADVAWTRSTERPYDTTQFIRDTKGKDGNLFARLAREQSREYGSMFDNVVSSDKGGYEWFERTAVDKYMTPHTGKFVQEIKSSPNGNYNKLKLKNVGGQGHSSVKDLQKQVDRAVDIANDNIGHPTPEDKLDAFIKAMDRIEDVNAKYVRRGKPTKAKEDAMNYLWQIHDDLQQEAVKYRNTLYPQRTEKGGILFNDNPTVTDVGTGETNWDDLMRESAENSDRIQNL